MITPDLRMLTLIGQGKAHPSFSLSSVIESSDDELIRGYAAWASATKQKHTSIAFHVSSMRGSDKNIGSFQSPVKTVRCAVESALPGDRIIIHEGVYRECIKPYCSEISIEAAQDEVPPVVCAMDEWSSEWFRDESNIYYVRITPNVGCEQIFVNSVLLTEVKEKEKLCLYSMWVDEDNSRIYVCLPDHPGRCKVERSVRQQCFVPIVRGLENIKVSGIRFVGGCAPIWAGPTWHSVNQLSVVDVNAGANFTIENCEISYGNAQGLNLGMGGFAKSAMNIPIVNKDISMLDLGEYGEPYIYAFVKWIKEHSVGGFHTVRGNKIHDNGISGIVAFYSHDLGIEYNEIVDNCIKPGVVGTCEECGIKFHAVDDSLIKKNKIERCCYGIWLDGDCARDRITQNLIVDSKPYGIFHEMSDGPVMIDSNTIIDTREGSDAAECGFYTHDGNNAHFFRNFVKGTQYGVKIRALLHRYKYLGVHTTTSGNKIYNNFFVNNSKGGISRMPEMPRCEDNWSDNNVFWNHGKAVLIYLENSSDVGLLWENSITGRKLGLSGSGDRDVELLDWSKSGNDLNSCMVVSAIFDLGTPRELSERIALEDVDFYQWHTPFELVDVQELIGLVNFPLKGWSLSRTVWLSPFSGIQIWKDSHGIATRIFGWNSKLTWEEEVDKRFCDGEVQPSIAIPPQAAGQKFSTVIGKGWSVLRRELEVTLKDSWIEVVTREGTVAGDYSVVLHNGIGWMCVPVHVGELLEVRKIELSIQNGKEVVVTIASNANHTRTINIALSGNGFLINRQEFFGGHETHIVSIPFGVVNFTVGEISVDVSSPDDNISIKRSLMASFACASREPSPLYSMGEFPYAVFPETLKKKAEDIQHTLRAAWRAWYNDKFLIVKVIAVHPIHRAFQRTMDRIHCEDGLKIGVMSPGGKAAVIGMALRSDDGQMIMGLCKTANEKDYPVGEYSSKGSKFTGLITREKDSYVTTYSVEIPWDLINLDGPPDKFTQLPFSIMLSKDDGEGTDYYGLRWFDGIKYDDKEGKEEHFGRLWIV
jgi:hypothetical protein